MEGRICNREYQFGLGKANSHQTRESIQQWLRQQIDERAWGVTMSHGIYSAWDRWEEPWILWDLFRELAYKSDTIWTETFAKVGAYVTERDAVKLDVVKKKGIITVTPSLDLDPVLFSEKLTLKVSGMPKPGSKAAKKVFGYRAVQEGKNLPLILKGDDLLCDFNPYGGPITIEPIKEDPLAGKTINIIGDSYVANHRQPYENAWHYKVAARHGMTYNNYGRNGGAIAYGYAIHDDTVAAYPYSIANRHGVILLAESRVGTPVGVPLPSPCLVEDGVRAEQVGRMGARSHNCIA